MESVERHEPRAGRLQRFQIARVVETERRVARDGDLHVAGAGRWRPGHPGGIERLGPDGIERLGRGSIKRLAPDGIKRLAPGSIKRLGRGSIEHLGLGGDPVHPIEIDVRLDAPRNPFHPATGFLDLGRGDETEMRGAERELGGTADCTEHRDVRIGLHRVHELRLMALPADLVQDEPSDPHLGVEIAVAAEQWSDSAGDAPGIHDENDRRREQLRKGGIAVGAVDRHAIVQPLVPLDEGKTRAFAAPRELLADLAPPHRVEVEVAAAPTRRHGQPHRIDVVRTLLERLHQETARA